MTEDYTWVAETKDKISYFEGKGILFSDIMTMNRAEALSYFTIIKDGLPKFIVKLGEKRKLIFFRRRMNHVSNKGTFQWSITCVGWEENVKGVSIKTILYIYPNGGVELNNDEPTMATAYHNKLISQFEGIQSMNSQSNEIRNI